MIFRCRKTAVILFTCDQFIIAALYGFGLKIWGGGKKLKIVLILRILLKMVYQQVIAVCGVSRQFRFSRDYLKTKILCIFGNFFAVGVNIHIVKNVGLLYMFTNMLI